VLLLDQNLYLFSRNAPVANTNPGIADNTMMSPPALERSEPGATKIITGINLEKNWAKKKRKIRYGL